MKKGLKYAGGLVVAMLAAAFMFAFMPATALSAKAAVNVTYSETTATVNNTTGRIIYKANGNKTITIQPKQIARNILKISIDNPQYKIQNIKCNKNLKYKITRKHYNEEEDYWDYYLTFYSAIAKNYTFKFSVAGQQYSVAINGMPPIKSVMWGISELSTKNGELGSYNYVTVASKGKLSVKLNKGYALKSIDIGEFRHDTDAYANKKTVVQWRKQKNNKTLKLSKLPQIDESDETYEESMISTTVIRVSYIRKKTGQEGYTDYYLNRFVDSKDDDD